MTQLLAWIAVCGLLSLLLSRRPVIIVVVALGLWFAVPAVASSQLTGIVDGPIAFHPSSWLIMVAFAVQLLRHPLALVRVITEHMILTLVLAVFLVGAIMVSQLNHSGGTTLWMDQLTVPALAFWLVAAFAPEWRPSVAVLRITLLVGVAAECVVAQVQRAVGNVLVYESDYERLHWFHPERLDRWMGFTDGPLVLSAAIGIAAPLTLGLRRNLPRMLLLALYLVGAVTVQSRVGVVVISLVIVFVVAKAPLPPMARLGSAIVVLAGGIVVASSSLVTGLAGRVADDTGSLGARTLAYQYFFTHWTSYLVLGRGLTSSYLVAGSAGLQTSLESSLLMYVIDVGGVLALLYFGSQMMLVVGSLRAPVDPGLKLSAAIAVLIPHSFSGLASVNLLGTVIWVVLALLAVSVADASRPPPPPRPKRPGRTDAAEVGSVSEPERRSVRRRPQPLPVGR